MITEKKVSEYMTMNPVTAHPEDSVTKAGELLDIEHFRHLPIVDDMGHVRGIISDRDLRNIETAMDFLADAIGDNRSEVKVKDVMTTHVISVDPDSSLSQAIDIFLEKKVGALPVTETGHLKGIITYIDILIAVKENC